MGALPMGSSPKAVSYGGNRPNASIAVFVHTPTVVDSNAGNDRESASIQVR